MFQNMLFTTVTTLQNTKEQQCWQNRSFVGDWPEDQESEGPHFGPIKKKKRDRTCFTTEQLHQLETAYKTGKYLCTYRKTQLAYALSLPERNIKVWFQNRRMKDKKKHVSICNSWANNTTFTPTGITPSTYLTPLDETKNEDSSSAHYHSNLNQDLNNVYTVSPPPCPTYNDNSTEQPQYEFPVVAASAPSDEHNYPTSYYPNCDYNYGENYSYSDVNTHDIDSQLLSSTNSDSSYFLLE